MSIVYLRGDSRKQEWGRRNESRRMREKENTSN